jgi:hypothetical protein
MSEFTDGLLILKTHLLSAQLSLTDLQHPYIVKNLNERWSVVVFESANPEDEPVHAWILKTSHDMPLLYFQHGEDHGWGYKIYAAGDQKASFDVDYGIAEWMTQELAEKHHPGVDMYGDLSAEAIEGFYAQVHASDDYSQRIAAQYAAPGLEHFALFGLSPEAITELRDILRPQRYEGRVEGFSQVEAFQKVLGIEEMSWMSYHYLSRPDNTGDFED